MYYVVVELTKRQMIIMSRMVSENLFIPLLYHNFILHFGVVPHKRVICPTNGWLGGGHPMDSCGPVSSLRFKILYCIGKSYITNKQFPHFPSRITTSNMLQTTVPFYISDRLTWRKPRVSLSYRMRTAGMDLALSQGPHFTSTLSHSQLFLWRPREWCLCIQSQN